MTISESEYLNWDATRMAELVRAGEVTPQELTDTAEGLLKRWKHLNAVATPAPTGPPTDETAADRSEVPFPGVPFAVKELLPWPGLPWTMGSRLLANNPAPGWSPYAERLSRSGATVIGTSTSSEFGLLGSTETALHGITENPWRAGVSAGGSSGGSAALVGAGVVPMAHGSDAGGSLRVPAALNGIVGFKPSAGRCLPTGRDASGLSALVVDHVMTRSVRDSARMLAWTERTGADAVHPPIGYVAGPSQRRLRVGVITSTLLGRPPDAAVRRELDTVVRLCAELGHEVEAIEDLGVDGAALSQSFFTVAAQTMAAMAHAMTPMLGRPPGPEEIEPFTAELIEWARGLGADAGARSERALASAAEAYNAWFERHDILLSPTLAVTCWPLGHLAPDVGRALLIERTERAVGYTPIHNAAGCPAVSLPLGEDDGLPVGIHLAAAPGQDATVLELAYQLEQAAPWWDRRPVMPSSR